MRLKTEQNQGLYVTEKLLQSTAILQMSSLELEKYIEEQCLENPVIDIDAVKPLESSLQAEIDKIHWLSGGAYAYERGNYGNYNDNDDARDPWDFAVSQEETLTEHVISQLSDIRLDERQKKIAHYVTYSLDDNGFLPVGVAQIAEELGVSEAEVAEVVTAMRELEPVGVCAENVEQALLLQIDRKGGDELAEKIVLGFMPQLARNELHIIAKRTGASIEKVEKSAGLIRSLDPKPGSRFRVVSNQPVRYDVIVTIDEGELEVKLLNDSQPQIMYDLYYKQLIKSGDEELKEYILNAYKKAEWLRECVAQRGKTLTLISQEIAVRQRDFFLNGPGNLRPLKMSDIAQAIGVHESTVSRAIKGKYLLCSHGGKPLSYFFQFGFSSADGSSESPERIRAYIKTFIEAENPVRPLSDRIICEKLNDRGIDISRRTVAKYRESMGIPGISGRRQNPK